MLTLTITLTLLARYHSPRARRDPVNRSSGRANAFGHSE